jgi:hypothetical protein
MSATIDGRSWSSTAAGATIQDGRIGITGQVVAGGESITLTLAGTAKGTYSLDAGTSHAGAYQKSSGSQAYLSQYGTGSGGTVTITEIDETNKTISGTFSMTGENAMTNEKVVITNGKFNKVKYTTTTTPTKNKMTAKVDGNAWEATSVFATVAMGKISISGTKNGAGSVGIFVPDDVTAGTYTFSMFGDYVAQYNPNSQTFYGADNGTITITSHDETARTLKGTFEFDASDFSGGSGSAEITEGSFEVKY